MLISLDVVAPPCGERELRFCAAWIVKLEILVVSRYSVIVLLKLLKVILLIES